MSKVKEDKALEYLYHRLRHTLDHTIFATKNLYLVNGALLALIYFILGSGLSLKLALASVAGVLALLGVINLFHAKLFRYQGTWYYVVEREIQVLLKDPEDRNPEDQICLDIWAAFHNEIKHHTIKWPVSPFGELKSTNHIYRAIHVFLGVLCLGLSVVSLSACFVVAA